MSRDYYMFQNGTLKRKENSLIFKIKSKNGEKKYIPVEDVDNLFCFGSVDLNKKLLTFLSQNQISVHFFNYYGFYTGTFYPREINNSGLLFVKQVKHYTNKKKRTRIARKILEGASFNTYRNVRYYDSRGKDLKDFKKEIADLRAKLTQQKSPEQLMGIEGNIKERYYRSFNTIIDQEINFKKRVKRPPDNMINTLISYCNAMVYTTVLGEIYKTQLSPVVSYLHEPSHSRFSLSLDLAEIFKPLLADRIIFAMLNRNQITKADFEQEINFLYLKDKGQKKIIKEYDSTLERTVKHKKLKRHVSYKHLIRLELYKLVKHLLGEKEYKPFKIWW
jgi:CRISPR-associated protein Cas1